MFRKIRFIKSHITASSISNISEIPTNVLLTVGVLFLLALHAYL